MNIQRVTGVFLFGRSQSLFLKKTFLSADHGQVFPNKNYTHQANKGEDHWYEEAVVISHTNTVWCGRKTV